MRASPGPDRRLRLRREPAVAPTLGCVACLVILVSLAMLLIAPASASADERTETRARAEAVLRQAEQDDEAFAFAAALARYDEGRALDPGSPRAPRAEARAAMLRAHAEGDFVPFTKLERVRRDPALSSDARTMDELVRDAETFPPGAVRVEVWVMAAEAYAHRLGRPSDAEVLLARALVDPRTDRIVAQKAARDLVALRVARGDLAGAEAAALLAGTRADPQLGRDVRRAVRRRNMHHAAIVVLATMGLLAARAWLLASRRGGGARIRAALGSTWKIALGYAAYVAVGGALLAAGYEAGTTRPFLYFGVALVPILLVARAWAASGKDTRTARTGRAALCAAGAVGAAFLVLESVDVTFLEGMGL